MQHRRPLAFVTSTADARAISAPLPRRDRYSAKAISFPHFINVTVKLPRFRRVVLDLGDYGSVVTASIAAS
jgi:hypothetical protein